MYIWRERNSQCLQVGQEMAGVAGLERVRGGGILRRAQWEIEGLSSPKFERIKKLGKAHDCK